MENFAPLSAIIGGGLIGLSAAILWVTNGRVAGISGVVGALIAPLNADFAWRAAFTAGILAAPLPYRAARGALPNLAPLASIALAPISAVSVSSIGVSIALEA